MNKTIITAMLLICSAIEISCSTPETTVYNKSSYPMTFMGKPLASKEKQIMTIIPNATVTITATANGKTYSQKFENDQQFSEWNINFNRLTGKISVSKGGERGVKYSSSGSHGMY